MQVSRYWRLNAQRYQLQGVTCPHCAANIFPPREVCPYCEAQVDDSHEPEAHAAREHAVVVARPAFSSAAR